MANDLTKAFWKNGLCCFMVAGMPLIPICQWLIPIPNWQLLRKHMKIRRKCNQMTKKRQNNYCFSWTCLYNQKQTKDQEELTHKKTEKTNIADTIFLRKQQQELQWSIFGFSIDQLINNLVRKITSHSLAYQH